MKPITKLNKRLFGVEFNHATKNGLTICIYTCPTTRHVVLKLLSGKTIMLNYPIRDAETLTAIRALWNLSGPPHQSTDEELVEYLTGLKGGISYVHNTTGPQARTPLPTPVVRTTMYR